MFRLNPFSHTLIAAGLVVGLAATSTLTVSVAPAGATAVDTVAATNGTLSNQALLVDAGADTSVFAVSRDASGVSVPPLVVWPVQDGSAITDGFGHREAPTDGASTEHPGIDFGAASGTEVHAAATGVVSRVQAVDHGGCGVNVSIDHVVRGASVTTVYCHLREGSTRVVAGQHVVVGEVIGAVGSTGVSTGAHLHFEVRPGNAAPVDPLAWLGTLAA